MIYEIMQQERQPELYVEAHFWRDETEKRRGDPPFLLNDFKWPTLPTQRTVLSRQGGKILVADGSKLTDQELNGLRVRATLKQFLRENPNAVLTREILEFFAIPITERPADWSETLPELVTQAEPVNEIGEANQSINRFIERASFYGWTGDRRGTTLNLQVAASADDTNYLGGGSFWFSTLLQAAVGKLAAPSPPGSAGTSLRFTGVSGLSGATIDSAVMQIKGGLADTGTPLTKIEAEDAESPTQITSMGDFSGRTRTTAKIDWDSPGLSVGSFNSSPDIKTVIQELADDYNPTEIQLFWEDDNSAAGDNNSSGYQYDNAAADAAKLDIDYTGVGTASLLPLLGVG